MEKKPCYLRKTEIVLMDGNAYTFRALPYNESTLDLIEDMEADGATTVGFLHAFLAAIRTSLSFDHTPEQIEDILGRGLIQLGASTQCPESLRIIREIRGALLIQASTPPESKST